MQYFFEVEIHFGLICIICSFLYVNVFFSENNKFVVYYYDAIFFQQLLVGILSGDKEEILHFNSVNCALILDTSSTPHNHIT
jgi:hypothetical protein